MVVRGPAHAMLTWAAVTLIDINIAVSVVLDCTLAGDLLSDAAVAQAVLPQLLSQKLLLI